MAMLSTLANKMSPYSPASKACLTNSNSSPSPKSSST